MRPQPQLARFTCLALDHRPQVIKDPRSGACFLVCERCSRFLGLAAAAGVMHVAKPPRGRAAAQRFASEALPIEPGA